MTNLTISTDGTDLYAFGGSVETSDYGDTFIATQSTASSVTFYAEGSLPTNSLDVRALIVPVSGANNFTAPIYTGAAQQISVSESTMTPITLSLGNTALTVGQEYAVLVEYVPTINYQGYLDFAATMTGTATQQDVWYNGQPAYPSLPASGQFASYEAWYGQYQSLEMNLSYASVAAPVVTISTQGILTNHAAQTIAGTVDVADAGSTVSIYDGTQLVGTATVAANGTWSANVTLSGQGANVIVAKDTNAGGTGTSASITYTLDTHTPVAPTNLAITSGVVNAAGASVVGHAAADIITGTAEAGDTVAVYNGTTLLGTTTAAANGSWSFTPASALSVGAHNITAIGTDPAGTASPASSVLTVDVDAGPTAATGSDKVAHGSSNDLTSLVSGLVTAGVAGDTETITAVSGANVALVNGKVVYTAPAAGGTGSFTYTVRDQVGDTATGTVNMTTDGGPTAANGAQTVAHGSTDNLTSYVDSLIGKGMSGDTETITGVSGTGASLVNGQVIYTAPVAGGTSSFTYTVQDQLGDTATGTIAMTTDGGPTIATGASSINFATGQNAQGVVQTTGNLPDANWALTSGGIDPETAGVAYTDAPGDADFGGWAANNAQSVWIAPNPNNATGNGDFTITDSFTLTAAQVASASFTGGEWTIDDSGTLVLNGHVIATLGDGSWGSMNAFTLPTDYLVAGVNTLSVVGTDSDDDIEGSRVQGVLTISQPQTPTLIGHGQSLNLTSQIDGRVTPGLTGDTETITAVSGTGVSLVNGQVTYTAPASAGPESFTYTVTDEYGDTTTGTYNLTVDGGPALGAGTQIVAHGSTDNLTSYINGLVTPGLTGDTETITAVSGAGVSLVNGQVIYTAPAAGGTNNISYTVTDQLGDTATGTVAMTVDGGPVLQNGALTLAPNQSENVTQYLDSLIGAGLPGDTETITAVSGNAALVNGQVTYTAPNQVGSDSFTYTVTDQRGDVATATVNASLDRAGNQVNLSDYFDVVTGSSAPAFPTQTLGAALFGSPFGNATIIGDAQNRTITAYGQSNTIVAGGGNDIINAGLSWANVTVSDTNGNNNVTGGNDILYASVTLGNGNNDIALGGQFNTISLGNGNNTVDPGNNFNKVTLGNGSNTLTTQGYDNSFTAGNGANTVNAGLGQANVTLGNGNNSLTFGGTSNVITLGSGNNTIDGTEGTGGAGSDKVTLGGGSNHLTLGGYNNLIVIGDGANTVNAGAGQENVTLGGGNNTLTMGGTGNVITIGNGNNTINGGAGQDTVTLGNGSNALTLSGYNNVIHVGNGNNTISGAQGYTTVVTGNGNNTITLAGILDNVTTAAGTSTIAAGSGNATVNTGAANDTVTLGGFDNTVIGGLGQDAISGGSYNTYELNGLSANGGLNIADFSAQANDVLDLSHVTAGLAAGWALSGAVVGGALDITLTTGGSSYMVAALHGAANTSLAGLIASHNVIA